MLSPLSRAVFFRAYECAKSRYIATIAHNISVDKFVRNHGIEVVGEDYLPLRDESTNTNYDDLLQRADEFGLDLWQIFSHNPEILRRYAVFLKWEDTECVKRLERRYLEGMKNTEQAILENVTEGTFNQQMRRCRNSFVAMYNQLVGNT